MSESIITPVMGRNNWLFKREDWHRENGINGTNSRIMNVIFEHYKDEIAKTGCVVTRVSHPYNYFVILYRLCKNFDCKFYAILDINKIPVCGGWFEFFTEMQETGIANFSVEPPTETGFDLDVDFSDIYRKEISIQVKNIPNDLDNMVCTGHLLPLYLLYGFLDYNNFPKRFVCFTQGRAFDPRFLKLIQENNLKKQVFLYDLDKQQLGRYDTRSTEIPLFLTEGLDKRAFVFMANRTPYEMEKKNYFWVGQNLNYLGYMIAWREFDPILYGSDSELVNADKEYVKNLNKEGADYANLRPVCGGRVAVSEKPAGGTSNS